MQSGEHLGPHGLLELSRRLIQNLPESPIRCNLAARNAIQSVRAGDVESARTAVTSAADEVRRVGRPVERAFAQIEVANACVEVGMIELARTLLHDAEVIYGCQKERPGMTSLLLFLVDGIARLGDLSWAQAITNEEPLDSQREILSGLVKRCAMNGLWKQVIFFLGDDRLEPRRKALCAETLILLAQANIDPLEMPRIVKSIEQFT